MVIGVVDWMSVLEIVRGGGWLDFFFGRAYRLSIVDARGIGLSIMDMFVDEMREVSLELCLRVLPGASLEQRGIGSTVCVFE